MLRIPLATGVLTLMLTIVLPAQAGSSGSRAASTPARAKAGQEGSSILRDKKGIPLDKDVQEAKSGLKYSILRSGKAGAAKPEVGDLVKVHYSGWLLDGTQFDSSKKRGTPIVVSVGRGRVIPGWDEGLQLMSVGSIFKFRIPYMMAYGERGRPPVIPAKAPLVFEMELLEVIRKPKLALLDDKLAKLADSGLKYQILDAGKGEAVQDGDFVVFKLAHWKLDGKLLAWSEEMRQEQGSYPAGPIGQLRLPFLNEALKLIQPGGKIRCLVPMTLSFGTNPPPNLAMSKDDKTMWELEIVERFKALPVPEFKMPAKEVLKKTSTGLQYEVLKAPKEGAKAVKTGNKVKVHYAGWLTSGKLFDSSYKMGKPFEITVDQDPVIRGWHEGLKLMAEGAVYRFIIPADLGYGAQGAGGVIPPNSTLVFQIEVLSVQ